MLKLLRKTLLLSAFVAFGATAFAQQTDDPVIFEIGGKSIHKSEFMKEFLRSIGKDPAAAPTACTYEKRQALENYVELFVNFRTKLTDAYALGYDTLPSLVKELKGYRDELAQPYLIDSATSMNILREAYERNQWSLHAMHILVKCKSTATPADTMEAYKKAMSYYERVMAGEDFLAVAQEANEERFKKEMVPPNDPRRRDNGDLGNFTVFDMVYPFESAAYSLQPGEISKPVRTAYGYHVIKLVSKIPFYGKTTFQHIWCANDNRPDYARHKIYEAYEQIQGGESFASVCRNYSDDQSTAGNGGLLSDLAVNQMPSEYVEVLSAMKPGEVSKPFETSYGWHILLLNRKESIASFEEMVPYYKQRMTRDVRSRQPREKFVEQCKSKYTFQDYTKMYMKEKGPKGKMVQKPLASLDECRAALTDSLFNRQWHYSDTMVTDLRPLFGIGDREYNAVDLLKYIDANQHVSFKYDLGMYLESKYNDFVNQMVFEYADSQLEKEIPEFASLVNEYRNGLMIFAYNDDKIWTKALIDSTGFKEYYDTYSQQKSIDNEADAPYFWGERAKITLVTVDDSSYIAPSKVVKILNKATKKNYTRGQIYDAINDASIDSATFRVEQTMLEEGKQQLLSASQWRTGVYVRPLPKGYQVVRVEGLVQPTLKSIKEARGYYVNDYQSYLEEQLNASLRRKYNVMIHQDVIDEITY